MMPQLANYAQINIVPKINRIPGVSSASILAGSKDYATRIWLNPALLESYKITPAEVMAAIQDKSSEAAPGKIGQDRKETFEYVTNKGGNLQRLRNMKTLAYERIPTARY